MKIYRFFLKYSPLGRSKLYLWKNKHLVQLKKIFFMVYSQDENERT